VARYHRILWSEGLFLTPHHFQQAALFQEDQLAERMALSNHFPWGVHSMEVDQELLATGTFCVPSFRGLFPRGISIRFPEIDSAPPQVDFKDAFDIRADHLDIYLGLPVRRSGWPNCRLSEEASEDRSEVRCSAKTATVDDENTGRGERTIQWAELNLKLLLGTNPRDNFECLQIARVEKDAAGGFKLVDSYIPPLLALAGSPFLIQLNRSILERLVTRSSGLASSFTESGADGRDITPANLRSFLLFSIINGAIPQLAHVRETPATHPEQLYQILARLAGQLATLHATRLHPRDVPAYRHDDPSPVFLKLEGLIADMLGITESPGYQVIRLDPGGEGRFQARIEKDRLLQPTAAIFLAVSSGEMDERDIATHVARIIVASPDRIDQKLSLNLRGLPLQLVAVPPPAIPRRRNTWYYQLDTRGSTAEAQKDWEAIAASKALAINIPRDILDAQFELLGLEATQ